MRVFANLFLSLFLVDGGISVLDELFTLFSLGTFFSGVRILVAGVVMMMSIAIYPCLGIDKRLPKRIILPLLLLLYWSAVGTWFFPVLGENRIYGLLMASVQVLLCYIPVAHFHCAGRFGLQLPEELFRTPFFSIKNTLCFVAANLVVIPLVLGPLVMVAADLAIGGKTAGFVRLTPSGLRMTERVYRLNNKTIRLVSMIHVAEKEYYADLFTPSASVRTIVLAEGVTDDRKLLRNSFGYGKMAGLLGLTSQETIRLKGRLVDADTFDESGFEPGEGGMSDVLRADTDISAFHPTTRLFLDAVGKQLTESTSLVQALVAINTWAEKNLTPDASKAIMDDILHRRNAVLISHLGQVLPRYDMIIIPWGALHMAEIEESVLKRGFVLQEERSRVGIDFRKLVVRKFGFS